MRLAGIDPAYKKDRMTITYVYPQRQQSWKDRNPVRVKDYRERYSQEHSEYNYIRNKIHSKRKIVFLGKQIYLGFNPRKGICSHCHRIGTTNLHHRYYVKCMPLAGIIELCVHCHNKEHGQYQDELGKFRR